jgi:hypothetical protein
MYIFGLLSFCLLPQIKIRDTLQKNYFQVLERRNDDDLNVHSTICEWGKAIKSDFDTTNAPFKLRHGPPDQAQVAQAFSLLHNLTKEALAAQGGILTQQGHQLMKQDKKIEELQDTVVEMRTMISELDAERSDMRTTISDLDAALMPRCQGGAQTALLPADPAPGDGPPPSVPAATAIAIAAPQPEPPPAPSSSSRVSPGGKDSTKSLSRTGVKDRGVKDKDKAPAFDTHASLIKVYVTFLRHKWTRAEDAGTWENKHHRSMGVKIYSWVHAIAAPEENDVLLTGSKTDDRGMTSPNVAKVETNLLKLVIGILYQMHMTYLPAVKMTYLPAVKIGILYQVHMTYLPAVKIGILYQVHMTYLPAVKMTYLPAVKIGILYQVHMTYPPAEERNYRHNLRPPPSQHRIQSCVP